MAIFLRSLKRVKKYTVNDFSTNTESIMANVTVKVRDGILRGSEKQLLDGTKYYSFKGIRYALPPIGSLRFMAPLPLTSWNGVHDALHHGSVCPQLDTQTKEVKVGNEDCLFLNIYTKSLEKSNIPVMVFIHGGGFMSGSGDSDLYGADFLLQHNVVLVTINYRLEMFGFLCLDIPEVPGNAGMKDQVAALQWVQNNVSNFGGDKNNVTIFGESAGAASVCYHLLSPMSKGLFHKAIAQSGSCLADWTHATNAAKRAFRAGRVLGKETDNPKELLKFLQDVPALDLVGMTFKTMTSDEKYRGLPLHFVPVVEKYFGNNRFLIEDPHKTLLSGKAHNIPLIIGYNSEEGIIMLPSELRKLKIRNEVPSYYVPRSLYNVINTETLEKIADKIMKFYFDGKELMKTDVKKLSALYTDLHFSFSGHCFAYYYATYCGPVYMYYFDYDTELNIFKSIMGFTEMEGAAHVDEIFYLFKNMFNHNTYNDSETVRRMVGDVTKLWTNFAKTGNPTSESHIRWPSYTIQNREYLNIGHKYQVGKFANQERIEFWNKLYKDAGLFISQSRISNL